jgi:hypothetical protein
MTQRPESVRGALFVASIGANGIPTSCIVPHCVAPPFAHGRLSSAD